MRASAARPLVLGLTAVLAIFSFLAYVHPEGAILRLGVGVMITVACWGAGWWWPGARAAATSKAR